MNGAQARSENMPEKMKDTASLVKVISAFALLGGILAARVPPMGEMGDFMYLSARVAICFDVWGLATGIGLLRKWRWARISMLAFGGILVACGVLPPMVMMVPLEDGKFVGWAALWTWQSIILKAAGLALLFVVLAGGVRWWKYFTCGTVKSYFREDRAPA